MLLIRSGFTHKYDELSEGQARELAHTMPPKACGMAQDEGMLQFLWEKKVASFSHRAHSMFLAESVALPI
ncbi:hypothetical protein BDV27DRAFT_128170 [Aspergillus caelatus]|uniref:Uncharacterized protein n=1 Tax=Aspergillus caelatus TaxID=61420 RepID=A0A5N7A4Y1_9EURO|nr:uncharacterized protein BDV27DRAFT_128170 [Aspergillus caelatus]KAE8364643.1 hypothetical protein BDV27DRAFT_128170 [Aspergillus caelatus]